MLSWNPPLETAAHTRQTQWCAYPSARSPPCARTCVVPAIQVFRYSRIMQACKPHHVTLLLLLPLQMAEEQAVVPGLSTFTHLHTRSETLPPSSFHTAAAAGSTPDMQTSTNWQLMTEELAMQTSAAQKAELQLRMLLQCKAKCMQQVQTLHPSKCTRRLSCLHVYNLHAPCGDPDMMTLNVVRQALRSSGARSGKVSTAMRKIKIPRALRYGRWKRSS